jgi:hypothetical protein
MVQPGTEGLEKERKKLTKIQKERTVGRCNKLETFHT